MNFKIKKTDIFYIFLYLNVFCKGIGLDNSSKLYLLLIVIGVISIFFKIIYDKFTKKEITIISFILLVGIGTFFFTKRPTFLLTCITLAGMKNIDIKQTFKGMFLIRVTTFILIVSLSLIGILENKLVLMYRDGNFDYRYSLGYGHPNTTQINLFIIVAIYIYLKYERLKFMDYAVIVGTNFFVYSYTMSRTGCMCILIIVVLTLYSKLVKRDKILTKLPKTIFIALFSFSVLTALLYGHFDFLDELDIVFNGRIAYSSYYCKTYGLSLFGENLIEDSNAIFDNGYLYFIIQFGLLCFCIVSYLLFLIFKKVKLDNDKKKAIMIIGFLICILTESFAPNIFMNIILLFAATIIYDNKAKN